MNTKPDDVMLALWLDDELTGADFTAVEAWAAGQPDQLALREETRSYRGQMAALLPREVEPPYADFFNTRIRAAITADKLAEKRQPEPTAKVAWWRAAWFMPTAAAAGMVLAFWGGTRANRSELVSNTPVVASSPVVYTPDNEVKANYFAGKNGSSTVIVLDGVSAIPDSTDFLETAWTAPASDIDSTASNVEDSPNAN